MDAIVCLGIDVSKQTLDAAVHQPESKRPPHKKFRNSRQGVHDILDWVSERVGCEPKALRVVMESSGEYGVIAATAFHAAGCEVIVCNPRRARAYATATGRLNKTDKCDAIALADYGTQPRLFAWHPPAPELAELTWVLRRLTRTTEDLKREKSRAETAEIGLAPQTVLQAIARSCAFQIEERRLLLEALEAVFNRNSRLCADRELLLTIPWVGPLAASHLVCVLRGRHFQSARQVVSLYGLAPVHKRSGTSLVKRARVPTRGNCMVRSVLYMASLQGLKTKTPEIRKLYDALRAKGLAARQALLAIMRRTVHIAFGILRHGHPYRADWHQHRQAIAASSSEPTDPNAMNSASPPSSTPVPPVPDGVVFNSVRFKTIKGVPTLVRGPKPIPSAVKTKRTKRVPLA